MQFESSLQEKQRYNKTRIYLYIFILAYLLIRSPCIGMNKTPGACVALKECEPIRNLIRENPRNLDIITQVRTSSVECNVKRSQVCCPGMSSEVGLTSGLELPTFDDGCGLLEKTTAFNRVINGQKAQIGTWPWISLLGYTAIDTSDTIKFKCGGTIISKRHVLTAAHCILRTLSVVRLGEHDLTKDTETTHVDIKISKALRHPDFSGEVTTSRSDIGLLYLRQDIQFTDKIKPICLPITPTLRSKSFVNYKPLIAGWGRFDVSSFTTSNVLLEAQIEIFKNQRCDDAYRKAGILGVNERFDDAYLCGGVRGVKNVTDACKGDSGGPLVAGERYNTKIHLVLIGVVSAGVTCGREDVPGLYSNTSYFIDWIEENVKKPF